MSSDEKPARHLTLVSAEKYQPMSQKENRPEVVKALVEMMRRIQNTPSKKDQKKGLPLFLVPQNPAD